LSQPSNLVLPPLHRGVASGFFVPDIRNHLKDSLP
jgi:hypothetical protein